MKIVGMTAWWTVMSKLFSANILHHHKLQYRCSTNPCLSSYAWTQHWGEAGDVHNLGLTWVEPTEAEEAAIQALVRTFLTPELMLLHKVATGEEEVSRLISVWYLHVLIAHSQPFVCIYLSSLSAGNMLTYMCLRRMTAVTINYCL